MYKNFHRIYLCVFVKNKTVDNSKNWKKNTWKTFTIFFFTSDCFLCSSCCCWLVGWNVIHAL